MPRWEEGVYVSTAHVINQPGYLIYVPPKQQFVVSSHATFNEEYSTSQRNGNPTNGNHLVICLLSSQKNRNSLTWVLVVLTVCFTYPVLYRFSAESRAGEWEL
jgi:hypothetical protein